MRSPAKRKVMEFVRRTARGRAIVEKTEWLREKLMKAPRVFEAGCPFRPLRYRGLVLILLRRYQWKCSLEAPASNDAVAGVAVQMKYYILELVESVFQPWRFLYQLLTETI